MTNSDNISLCYETSIMFIKHSISGVARGGSCPRSPPRGGRQNPAKEFLKNYILKKF